MSLIRKNIIMANYDNPFVENRLHISDLTKYPISLTPLAEKIIKITNSKSKIVFVQKETNRPFRFVLDIKKAKKVLNWLPKVRLRDGLGKTIEWFRAILLDND